MIKKTEFLFSLLLVFGSLMAEEMAIIPTCVVGSYSNGDLGYFARFGLSATRASFKSDDFIKFYIDEQIGQGVNSIYKRDISPEIRSCAPTTGLAALTEITAPTEITRECVKSSLLKAPYDVSKSICYPNGKTVTYTKKDQIPCITEQTIDYITWATNKAIKCLSTADDPIEPSIIYKWINNESGFAFFVHSGNGKGTNQLTTRGALAMEDDCEAVLKRESSLLDNPECAPFKTILETPIQTTMPGKKCQYLDLENGVGRSLLHGIGLYLCYRSYHRYSVDNAMNDLFYKKGESNTASSKSGRRYPLSATDYKKIRDHFALALVNAGGPSQVTLLTNKKAAQITNYDDFRKIMKAYLPSMDVVDAKLKETFANKEEIAKCVGN